MANLTSIKKGDQVILRLFTGAFTGVKEVEKADKSYIYFTTRSGLAKFSKKTGKQVDPEPKSERFASYIEEFDEDVVAAEEAKKASRKDKKKPVKKPVAKATKEVEDDEDEVEAQEEEQVKKPKKKVAKKSAKKPTKRSKNEEDDDFEEID